MLCSFVTPGTPPFDVMFNRLAAKVTGGPYCHVETAFEGVSLGKLRELQETLLEDDLPDDLQRVRDATQSILQLFPPQLSDDHKITVAFHALAGCPLGCRVLSEHSEDLLYRPYDDTWRVYRLEGAPDNVVQANLVWSLSKVGLPYDTMGALTSPWRSNSSMCDAPDPEHWFCSNLSLRFLQHLNICSELSMFGTTPNALEKGLSKYIPPQNASSDNSGSTTGGVVSLSFDKEHWGLVSSVIPYVIRSKLRILA